jgi:hypothetical protein
VHEPGKTNSGGVSNAFQCVTFGNSIIMHETLHVSRIMTDQESESYLAILGRHAYLHVAARGWMLFPIAPGDFLPSQSWRRLAAVLGVLRYSLDNSTKRPFVQITCSLSGHYYRCGQPLATSFIRPVEVLCCSSKLGQGRKHGLPTLTVVR